MTKTHGKTQDVLLILWIYFGDVAPRFSSDVSTNTMFVALTKLKQKQNWFLPFTPPPTWRFTNNKATWGLSYIAMEMCITPIDPGKKTRFFFFFFRKADPQESSQDLVENIHAQTTLLMIQKPKANHLGWF